MRIVTTLALVALWATTSAAVSVNAYLADEQTPLPLADPNIPGVYRDIMVGTRLTLVVSSETERFWSGLLWSSWEDYAVGSLYGRDYTEIQINPDKKPIGTYAGSCLEGAGPMAFAQDYVEADGTAIAMDCLYASTGSDWFILDYYSNEIGLCHLGFYELTLGEPVLPGNPTGFSPGLPPNQGDAFLLGVLEFNHVPSRDFTGDATVNFTDFAALADQWRQTVEIDPNGVVSPCDVNTDDSVDLSDLALFCEYWLERADVNLPADDPNNTIVGQ